MSSAVEEASALAALFVSSSSCLFAETNSTFSRQILLANNTALPTVGRGRGSNRGDCGFVYGCNNVGFSAFNVFYVLMLKSLH